MMGLVALVTHRNLRISGRDAAVLGLLAVMYAATSLGLLRSYDYIPSGVATTVNFLYPLVVAIVMALFFRERSSVWIVVAIFISLVGVALLAIVGGSFGPDGGASYVEIANVDNIRRRNEEIVAAQ